MAVPRSAWPALVSLVAALAACSSGVTGATNANGRALCAVDGDCPAGFLCRDMGCACRDKESCKAGEFCNSQGACQHTGCSSNADCASGTYCDVFGGSCIADGACGASPQCALGSVCDQAQAKCVAGCADDGDCPLYSVCQHAGGAAIGTCTAGICDDRGFCKLGEICNGSGQCVRDPDPNQCKPCSDASTLGQCGNPESFCLVNPAYEAGSTREAAYTCAVHCTPTPDSCPNGYECSSILELGGSPCAKDADCKRGATDTRVCVIEEGRARGSCTCADDADCDSLLQSRPARCAKTCGGLGVKACSQDSDCAPDTCSSTCRWPVAPPKVCVTDDQCDPTPLCVPTNPDGSGTCIGTTRACRTSADCVCINSHCIYSNRACTTAADCKLSCVDGGCQAGAACKPVKGIGCANLYP